MRRAIIVLGFFIFVLFLFAGCTSTQSGVSAGSKSQNHATWDIILGTTYGPGDGKMNDECWLKTSDITRFQKFFPDVSGWTREDKPRTNYLVDKFDPSCTTGGQCYITYKYQKQDNPRISVTVTFNDNGACTQESTGVYKELNDFYKKKPVWWNATTKIDNYHGYPAIKLFKNTILYSTVNNYVGITNRLHVEISGTSVMKTTNGIVDSEAEIDADIEKFADAIDFNGIAASA